MALKAEALAVATTLLLACQRHRVPGGDVWVALRATAHIESHAYSADALHRLLRRRGHVS